MWGAIEYERLSVPLNIILLTTIFSVPMMIPSLQTTPSDVLRPKVNQEFSIERQGNPSSGLQTCDLPLSFDSFLSVFDLVETALWRQCRALVIKLRDQEVSIELG